jgi:hypothetical protein
MSAAPARSFSMPQPVDSAAQSEPATASGQKSFANLFEAPTAGRGRRVEGIDSDRFRAWFAPAFARWLQAHFQGTEQVAVAFGVRHQTAINWWHGTNRASGDTVALVFISFPSAVGWFLAEWRE